MKLLMNYQNNLMMNQNNTTVIRIIDEIHERFLYVC